MCAQCQQFAYLCKQLSNWRLTVQSLEFRIFAKLCNTDFIDPQEMLKIIDDTSLLEVDMTILSALDYLFTASVVSGFGRQIGYQGSNTSGCGR